MGGLRECLIWGKPKIAFLAIGGSGGSKWLDLRGTSIASFITFPNIIVLLPISILLYYSFPIYIAYCCSIASVGPDGTSRPSWMYPTQIHPKSTEIQPVGATGATYGQK